ncbi:MAG: hypothetical protein R8G66_20405 [Cytophagales bacterium]|nr:hypothetical protein [Cytophagales bacterium]
MSKTHTNIKHEGTTQKQRLPEALAEDFVKMEDRTKYARIRYLYEISKYVKFYDETNKENGRWSRLLEMDEIIPLAEVRSLDVKTFQDQFSRHMLWAKKGRGHARQLFLGRAASVANNLVNKFSDYRTRIERANVPESAQNINKEWKMALDEMHRFQEQIKAKIRLFHGADEFQSNEYFDQIKRLFRQMTHSVVFLQSQTEKFLELSFGHDGHQPHLAMLIAFADLLHHSGESINTFPARHKSFYFKDLLKFRPRDGNADQAIVNLQLAEGFNSYEIPRETAFIAGQDSEGRDIIYRSIQSTVLNRATIGALKGIHVERSEDSSSETLNLHQFEYPLQATDEDWPILGDLGASGHENAHFGFVIESPYLLLKEESRNLEFDIHCSTRAFGLVEVLKSSLKDMGKVRNFGNVRLKHILSTELNQTERGVEATIGNFFLKNMAILSIDDKTEVLPEEDYLVSDYFFNSIFRINGGDFAATPVKAFLETAADDGETLAEKMMDVRLKDFIRLIERKIRIRHELNHLDKFLATFEGKKDPSSIKRLFRDCLNIYYTSAEGWVKIDPTLVTCPELYPGSKKKNYTIKVLLVLDENSPGLEPLVYEEDDISYFHSPAVRFELNPTAFVYPYDFFSSINLDKIDCRVSVRGLKSLVGYNQLGPLDISMPFAPFGPTPNLDSYLILGNSELFRKDVNHLGVNIEWMDLPKDSGGFRAYYNLYDLGIENHSFKAKLSVLKNGDWAPLTNEQQEFNLFENEVESQENNTLSTHVSLEDVDTSRLAFEKDFSWNPEELHYDHRSKRGFLKLQLSNPSDAFGHQFYPNLLSKLAFNNARNATRWLSNMFNRDEEMELPELPYTPKINRVTLDYDASFSLEFTKNKKAKDFKTRFHHLLPFEGYNEIPIGGRKTGATFIPQFRQEGILYIGVKDLKPFDTLTLFFNMKERVTEQVTDKSPKIYWAYLEDNSWRRFQSDQIIKDSTDRLLHSGIVKLDVGPFDTSNNTILTNELYWIRVSALEHTEVLGMVTEISTQAIELTYDRKSEGFRDLDENLAPGSIAASEQELVGIDTISQALESQGGQGAESDLSLDARISERLRHKNRCVDLYGYERIVLDHFPSVNKILCLSATDLGMMGLSPGRVILVVIPKTNNRASLYQETPTVSISELREIRKYLETMTSPFVKLTVINPLYEKLRVFANVKFKRGVDVGFYHQQLNRELKSFISPWLKGTEEAPSFQRKIPVAQVESFIQSRDYIEFVTKVSLLKVNQNLEGGEEELLPPLQAETYAGDTLEFNVTNPKDEAQLFSIRVKLGRGEEVKERSNMLLFTLKEFVNKETGNSDLDELLLRIERLVYEQDYVAFVTRSSLVEKVNGSSDRTEGWCVLPGEEWLHYEVLDTGENTPEIEMEEEEVDKEKIQGKYPWSLLTTASKHVITTISIDQYEAPDQAGIEELYLDEDFVIRNDE